MMATSGQASTARLLPVWRQRRGRGARYSIVVVGSSAVDSHSCYHGYVCGRGYPRKPPKERGMHEQKDSGRAGLRPLQGTFWMFLNDWKESGLCGVQQAFGLTGGQLRDSEILLAAYGRDEFGGEAFVLFRRGGVLYEVNALRGSEGGLLGQWEPEETSIRALTHRLEKGLLGRTHRANPFADELRFLLAQLEWSA